MKFIKVVINCMDALRFIIAGGIIVCGILPLVIALYLIDIVLTKVEEIRNG